MRVHVRRHRVGSTPSTSQRLGDGVLTVRTQCAVGFIACRTDYRSAVPPRVAVRVRKSAGIVDAVALGGERIDLDRVSRPVTVRTRGATPRVARRD